MRNSGIAIDAVIGQPKAILLFGRACQIGTVAKLALQVETESANRIFEGWVANEQA